MFCNPFSEWVRCSRVRKQEKRFEKLLQNEEFKKALKEISKCHVEKNEIAREIGQLMANSEKWIND